MRAGTLHNAGRVPPVYPISRMGTRHNVSFVARKESGVPSVYRLERFGTPTPINNRSVYLVYPPKRGYTIPGVGQGRKSEALGTPERFLISRRWNHSHILRVKEMYHETPTIPKGLYQSGRRR